jgi:hypothetical protein
MRFFSAKRTTGRLEDMHIDLDILRNNNNDSFMVGVLEVYFRRVIKLEKD